MKEPPRQAELPGKDKITVPAAKPPSLEVQKPKEEEPDPIAQLNIPAATLASATESLPGAIEAPPGPPTPSLGIWQRRRRGHGPGDRHRFRAGLGSRRRDRRRDWRRLLQTGQRRHAAGRAPRGQAAVHLGRDARQGAGLGHHSMRSCRTDGTVGDVSVVRSLDSTFGLDEEAMKAARQWRFRPGTRLGEPVPVIITIELDVHLAIGARAPCRSTETEGSDEFTIRN